VRRTVIGLAIAMLGGAALFSACGADARESVSADGPEPAASTSSRDGAPDTGTWPQRVPPGARLIDGDERIDDEVFFGTYCADGVAALATARLVIYADVDCLSVPPDDAFRAYLGETVDVIFFDGAMKQVHFVHESGTSLGFGAERMWVGELDSE
jgi:hypothetical protein